MIRREVPTRAAQQILARNRVSEPAVNVEDIIRVHGVDLLDADLPEEVSGLLYIEEGKNPKIIVNKSHHQNRRRFTMAHELGHFILHKNQGIHIDKKSFSRNALSQTGLDPIEIEANRFAAELLMPKKLIDKEIRGHEDLVDINDDLIYELAKNFQVSTAAMSIRLESLGYLPRGF